MSYRIDSQFVKIWNGNQSSISKLYKIDFVLITKLYWKKLPNHSFNVGDIKTYIFGNIKCLKIAPTKSCGFVT